MENKIDFQKRFKQILIGSVAAISIIGIVVVLTIFTIKGTVTKNGLITNSINTITNEIACERAFLLNAWSDTVFVKTGSNTEYNMFMENAATFEKSIATVREDINDEFKPTLDTISKNFNIIKGDFLQIADLIKKRGFKDLGYEGEERAAVHHLENSPDIADKSLVLTLRKHEKDFFMRKDKSYLDKWNDTKAKFFTELYSIQDEQIRGSLLQQAQIYANTIEKIVQVEEQIGLSKSLGLRGQMNSSTSIAVEALNALKSAMEVKTNSLIRNVIISLIMVFLLIALFLIIGLNKFIKPVFQPMEVIQSKAHEISEGNLSVEFTELEGNKMIGDLINGFKSIVVKLKSTLSQIEDISAGKQKEEFVLNSDHDQVGVVLNKIIVQTNKLNQEEAQRNWHNKGLAYFASLMRTNDNDATKLYDVSITEFVKYMEANQGALFIVDGEEGKAEYLSMKGCYAYNRKKFMDMRVEFAEGIVGMCWAEGEPIILTEIPENYIKITSGLGDANPRSIMVVPLKFNDKTQGVIEIASFNKFEEHHIKFAQAVAETMGSVIYNSKINLKTMELLKASKTMTEGLRAQEEELRQNMEEMQATQEEMKRIQEEAEAQNKIINGVALVYKMDLKGGITYVNDEFTKWTKYSAEEAMGKNHSILKSGDKYDSVYAEMWESINNGKTFRGELQNKAKDGSFFWVDAIVAPVLNANGKPKQYIAQLFVINEIKKKEEDMKQMLEEMKAQEEELRQNMEEMQATQEEVKRIEEEKKNRKG